MDRPKKISKTLVDADIVAYRCSASANNETVEEALKNVDDLMEYILQRTVSFPTSSSFKCYLSGESNFRKEVAKTHKYKGNRTGEKPIHLPAVRDYLVREYEAVVSVGCEADDLIAMEVMRGDPETTVIASIDKDFQTVSCWMYNFTKDAWKYSTEWDALKYFYEQMLTGDAVDNIKGLYRVGPVKAKKILEGAQTEQELYEKVLKAYDGDAERVLENAQLLHLQRYERELWEPPV